jgi:glutathione S-transferase
MKLYFIQKTRATRVAWLLEEMGLEYDLHRFEFADPALRSAEYRAVHPIGRVPALEDGDVTIFETGAILEYLLSRYPHDGLRPDPDDVNFPAYLQWLHYAEGMIMPQINVIMVETVFLPPERRSEPHVKRARKLLPQLVAPLEAQLEDRDYLAGNFTAADITSGAAAISARINGTDFSEFPRLDAYCDRLMERPAFKRAVAL